LFCHRLGGEASRLPSYTFLTQQEKTNCAYAV
jgi:hypothetical protein